MFTKVKNTFNLLTLRDSADVQNLISSYGLSYYLPVEASNFITLKDYIGEVDAAVVLVPCIKKINATSSGYVFCDTGITLHPTKNKIEWIGKIGEQTTTSTRGIFGLTTNATMGSAFTAGLNVDPGQPISYKHFHLDYGNKYYRGSVETQPEVIYGHVYKIVLHATSATTCSITVWDLDVSSETPSFAYSINDATFTPGSETIRLGSAYFFQGDTYSFKVWQNDVLIANYLCCENYGSTVYDTTGNGHHATIKTDTQTLIQTWSGLQTYYNPLVSQGFQRFLENSGTKIIQVPYLNSGEKISPTITGYTRVNDYDPWQGGINCNKSYIDFNPDNLVSPPIQVEIWDRENEDIWGDGAREGSNPAYPYRWTPCEMVINNMLTWLRHEYRGKIYLYNRIQGGSATAVSDILTLKINGTAYKSLFDNYFKNQR